MQKRDNDFSLHRLDNKLSAIEKIKIRRQRVEERLGRKIVWEVDNQEVAKEAEGKNIEQMVGVTKVPLGLVGPIEVAGQEIFAPLTTTEGALVASIQRGLKTIRLATKKQIVIEDKGMTRAPVFKVKDIRQARKIKMWLGKQETIDQLQKIVATTSSHLRLIKIEMRSLGKSVYIKFWFDTQAAMGMNMVTIASNLLVKEIERKWHIQCLALSGNGCVDKKPAWINVLSGRGMVVEAEVEVDREIVRKVLKTEPSKIVEVVREKQWLGGMMYGGMGFNAHFANIVAAFYLATGQDLAHTVEGSLGWTSAEMIGENLYFVVKLPSVLVGAVGGGTSLPSQQNMLKLMGIEKNKEGKKKLATILGWLVLGGELSLTAALAAGQLACAHQKLARRNDEKRHY